MNYHASGNPLSFFLRAGRLALFTLVLASAVAARAQTVIANPVGEIAAGEGLTIDAENSQGIRFSIAGELTVTGITATFLSSDGNPVVAVFMRTGEDGFPASGPINPGHPDVVNPGDAVLFSPGVFSDTPTPVQIDLVTTLGAGEYIFAIVPLEYGYSSVLQAYGAVSGSETVSYAQEFGVDGWTGAWSLSDRQADIRIQGTLAVIPEPATAGALLAGAGILFTWGTRRHRASRIRAQPLDK
ncbi:PEP-CTERM putative exosortase interaction domain-containing protein [Opitutaceae bacterium TAV1]|nr:PEP-CTERM putative exosortase interaction domain-containing protein [Opitutaceae bacterium TAV1]